MRTTRRSLALAIAVVATSTCSAGRPRFPWPADSATTAAPESAEVTTRNREYHRSRSRVLVRDIKRPTRANLDYAAYHANAMIESFRRERAPAAVQSIPPVATLFGGVLVPGSAVATLAQTPLTHDEQRHPFAFSPLVDALARWDHQQARPLDEARTAVRSESWGGNRSVEEIYQEIADAFLHRTADGQRQLWVKIEFSPGALPFADMPDDDGDGLASIYAQLDPGRCSAAVWQQLETDYLSRELNPVEVRAWANELASYWYPSYNTDLVDLGTALQWPVRETEPEIVAEIGDLIVAAPTVVMRGKPVGAPIYNLFVVAGMPPVMARTGATAASAPTSAPSSAPPSAPQAIAAQADTVCASLQRELEQSGRGSYPTWASALRPLHDDIRARLGQLPAELKALRGRDGFLFFRDELEFVLSGDLRQQPPGKNPYAAIVEFRDFLARLGVDFLLVPVPNKIEVYPEKFVAPEAVAKIRSARGISAAPASGPLVVNPYGRKFLQELCQSGVETVDLLPVFLAAKADDARATELLYLAQDTHWTDRGLQLAAQQLAARIQRYPWYRAATSPPLAYSTKQVEFKHHGDLVSRLAEEQRGGYPVQTLTGTQVVNPDGTLYDDDLASPLVVLGDSFTGVYQRTMCRNGGVSAHLAKELGRPVDLVMSYGGGPNVRKILLRRGVDDLRNRRLVIWIFAARDLYDHWEDWLLLDQQGS